MRGDGGVMGKSRIGRFREGKGPIGWGVWGELNSEGEKKTTRYLLGSIRVRGCYLRYIFLYNWGEYAKVVSVVERPPYHGFR